MIDPKEHSDLAGMDSRWFKAFYWAARELNFTVAARKAGMTQSGVSQQVAKIEEALRAPVFERFNKQVHLTSAGQLLLEYIESQSEAVARLKEAVSREGGAPHGRVRYAMPHSCLFTPHFPLLLRARKKFPDVTLEVELCSNEDVLAGLMERRFDFGFLTRRTDTAGIAQELFARETYQLVGGESPWGGGTRFSAAGVAGLPFVDYPGMSNLFEIWRRRHFPGARTLSFSALHVAGRINSLHGAVTMLREGLGYTVMPSHCAEPWLNAGKLKSFCPKDVRVESDIFIATRKGGPLPSRVSCVIDAFRAMKKG